MPDIEMPAPTTVRLDPEAERAIADVQDRESCTQTHAIRQLIKLGYIAWKKERAVVDAMRAS